MSNDKKPAIISHTYDDDGTPEGVHISTLGCSVTAVYIDPEHNACLLVLPGMSCTNMTGAIELAKALLPSVELIATCNEFGWDTSYVKAKTTTMELDSWESRAMKKEDSSPDEVAGTLMSSSHCLLSKEEMITTLTATRQYTLLSDFFDEIPKSRNNIAQVM